MLSSFFIARATTSHNKFTHLLISSYFCSQNIHFCMKKKFSSHIKDMLYVLLLPLLFIAILLSRFFDRMDEKIHLRTILAWIFSPITALYRVTMGSEKDFWQERFVLLIICSFLVIIHFYTDLLINK